MRQRLAFPNLPALGELAAADNNDGSVNPSGRIAPILSMARRVSRPPQRAGAPFIWNMASSHRVLPGEARSFRTGTAGLISDLRYLRFEIEGKGRGAEGSSQKSDSKRYAMG